MVSVVSVTESMALESAPPEKGGLIQSLGMPPVYKGYGGFELQWYRPSDASELAGLLDLGLTRDLGSPIVGIAALGIEGYAGVRSGQGEFDGGGRAYFAIPSFHIGAGYDYNFTDKEGSFLFGLSLPVKRGGIFGRGSTLNLRWMPGYDQSFSVGVGVPLWGRNLGKTRPKRDSVELDKRRPQRLDVALANSALNQPLQILRERATWIARLTQPFAEHTGADPHKAMAPVVAQLQAHLDSTDALFPRGHTLNEEIRIYHETLDFLFTMAVTAEPVQPGQCTPAGYEASTIARQILLDDVLYPYNYLLGQRKDNDSLIGMIAVAQADFARWILSNTDIPRNRARDVFYVFQTLCDIMEENRRELRERWEDSRFVWLPLQYGLKPEEHDSQAELNAIIECASRHAFTQGNRVWYVINEQFQWEIARSVHRAEDYHVLWIHDIRGNNGEGKPDQMAYNQVRNYLVALTNRIRAYDRTGKLPVYMIFLDQHYFEINKSRLWLRLLSDPMNHKMNLPKGYEEWEQRLQELQDQLRDAVQESELLRVEHSQYGDKWLKNRIKIHVNITNPADPSFWSWHIAGIIPMPDNNMRDHRKIAFYDVTEADPYKGLAMFTGMGIGEHYIGANWEDRAVMIQGPGALAVKDAARQLIVNQGFEADEIPFPLRPVEKDVTYEQQIAAELATLPDWTDDRLEVMQVHSETGFRDKPINPAKAVLYSLMPPGSLLQIPDSLWQSYLYASLLAGSSLRGSRVLVIAPALKTAPSSGAPQMARAHGLMGRIIAFSTAMEQPIGAAGGLLKVGLYAPRQGVGDIAGRIEQSVETVPAWASQVYKFHTSIELTARNARAQLDSLGYKIHYLSNADSTGQPMMHLKANFFASQVAWDKLTARPEWAGVLREYVVYLAAQATPDENESDTPDVQAIPEELVEILRNLLRNFLADLTPQEREEIVYYFNVGSVNMDPRSMCLDGEAMILMAGWQALEGIIDFLLLSGLCEWLETTEELDALLPPPGGFSRSTSGLIKLML